jgi:RNA polymerase sigma factor (sigma-70 family)
MTPLLSDARLARQATTGDQRAFATIYRRYHQDLYRFCLSILGRPEDAQDALQNTMVKALRSLPGEEREIQLKPWLYRVAHNESIDLLRKRRDGPELDGSQASGAAEVAETVVLRERLGRLLADLGELPERQRSALVMRELAGLGYEQIGETFETSASVARQTVYEARLNLRRLETGREMSCDQVTRQLSDADGRITRRHDIQAHLRACAECRAFRDSIDARRHDLAALSPLPAALAASILHGLAGGQAATAVGGGAAAAGVGAGAGKVAATSVALKAVATVAVVATVGVTAADRGGLVDAGLPGGTEDSPTVKEKQAEGTGSDAIAPVSRAAPSGTQPQAGVGGDKRASRRARAVSSFVIGDKGDPKRGLDPPPSNSHAKGGRSSPRTPASLPGAARHGQETAAAHKTSRGERPGRGQGPTANGHDHNSSKSAHVGQGPSKASPAGRGSSGSYRGPRAHSTPSKHAPKGGTGGGGQPSKASPKAEGKPAQPEAQTGGAVTETGTGNDAKPEASP